jgi:hypothetical protein
VRSQAEPGNELAFESKLSRLAATNTLLCQYFLKGHLMSQLLRLAALSVVILVQAILCAPCQADPPQRGLKNTGEDDKWISRRHKGDPNNSDDVAVVLEIRQDPDVPADPNKVVGHIWLYQMNAAENAYDEPRAHYELTGTISHTSGSKRNRDQCKLYLDGDEGIVVWVSLYRNKINAMGNSPRAHQRVVARYKEGKVVDGELEKKAKACQPESDEDCCETEPNDDVLEEEAVPGTPEMPPMPPYDEMPMP